MSEIRHRGGLEHLRGAVPLNTSTFVESWPKLDEALADVSRDEPVHMFCTGVRCVKAGAYVKQKLGFTDVRRPSHGAWSRLRAEAAGSGESRFEGENFVFDKRVRTPSLWRVWDEDTKGAAAMMRPGGKPPPEPAPSPSESEAQEPAPALREASRAPAPPAP